MIPESSLSIITEDGGFSMGISKYGTILFAKTHTPSDKKQHEWIQQKFVLKNGLNTWRRGLEG